MAFRIKPEDVPEFLAGLANERFPDAYTGTITKGQIALFIEDAIEAGLVSPPVYTVRDNQGNLLDDEVYGLWATPDAATSVHKEDYTAEHWKGQTE